MNLFISHALNLLQLRRLEYADIRLVNQVTESIETRNGTVEGLANTSSLGYGIRVLYQGAWGFAACNLFNKKSIEKTIRQAIEVAKASSLASNHKVRLSSVKPAKGIYKTPYRIDPFKIPLHQKIDLLLKADKLMLKNKKVKVSQSFYQALKIEKDFASCKGANIHQEILETGAGCQAMAIDQNEVQNRSYPNSFRGLFQTRGWELVEEIDLAAHAPKVAQEAVALLTASQCPAGEFDLILDGPQLALQVHESCGHPTELDRVLGFEASYAGTSFMTPDGLGKLKYGSSEVNIVADATALYGLGTFGWDDEGVPAQKSYLIKKGIHVGYLTSRETAPVISQKSNGCMRADGWENLPIIRMTNINLEPGNWTLPTLIADTKKGIYMSTNKAWSIDDKRLNFQFGCEAAWEIKNGKLGRMYKNPSYTGITPQFWQSCDAICDKDYWQIWGTPNCGKGEPTQLAHVSHGTSPARFRKVKVGVMRR